MISARSQQLLALECACCKQVYHPERSFNDAFDVGILGTERYVVCVVCGLNVPDDMRTDDYKRRWRRALKAQLQDENLRLLIALSTLMDMGSRDVTDELFRKVHRRLLVCFPDKTLPQMKMAGDKLRRLIEKNSV